MQKEKIVGTVYFILEDKKNVKKIILSDKQLRKKKLKKTKLQKALDEACKINNNNINEAISHLEKYYLKDGERLVKNNMIARSWKIQHLSREVE